MSNYWKSILFVWFPMGFVAALVHRALWGPIDNSSFAVGMVVVFIAQILDVVFGYERPRERR